MTKRDWKELGVFAVLLIGLLLVGICAGWVILRIAMAFIGG